MTGLQGSQGSNATGGLNSSKESEGVVDRYNKWVLSGPVQKFILFTVPQTFNEYLNPLYYAVNGTYGAVTGKDIVYNTPMGKGEAGINLAFAFIPGGTEELGAYRAGMRGLLKQETQQVAKAFIKTANGIEVTGFTRHALNRIIQRGVKPQAILDALKNPLKIGKVITDQLGRQSQRFIGRFGEVVINPQTGQILSVNPTSSSKAAKLLKQLGL